MDDLTIAGKTLIIPEIWGVRWATVNTVHAVMGRSSRITVCGRDFIGIGFSAVSMPTTCLHCLELLGCLPVEV